MISVILIPAPITSRKAYSFDNEDEKLKYTDFKVGGRVLPAEYFNNETPGVEFYYKESHSPYEKHYIGVGGIETRCSDGSIRTFYPDSVIIHPNSFEMRNEKTEFDMNGDNIKKRGRKGDPEKVAQREEMERIRLEKIEAGIPIRRGRPSIDPSLRKSKPYIPNGGKRGRKPLSPDEKIRREQENNKTEEKRQRGRPAVPGLRELKQVDKLKLLEAKLKLGIITGRGRISDEDNQRLKQYLKTL